MPLYVYKCIECENKEEKLKHFSKMDEYEKCSVCGKEMKRIPAASNSFKFTGVEFSSSARMSR